MHKQGWVLPACLRLSLWLLSLVPLPPPNFDSKLLTTGCKATPKAVRSIDPLALKRWLAYQRATLPLLFADDEEGASDVVYFVSVAGLVEAGVANWCALHSSTHLLNKQSSFQVWQT